MVDYSRYNTYVVSLQDGIEGIECLKNDYDTIAINAEYRHFNDSIFDKIIDAANHSFVVKEEFTYVDILDMDDYIAEELAVHNIPEEHCDNVRLLYKTSWIIERQNEGKFSYRLIPENEIPLFTDFYCFDTDLWNVEEFFGPIKHYKEMNHKKVLIIDTIQDAKEIENGPSQAVKVILDTYLIDDADIVYLIS